MTSSPSLQVVTTDPTPPYEQLRRQLAELIREGVLSDGERLPPLRQLAADLGLAVGTVARTYRELETAGLVVSRRGGGTRVRRSGRPTPEQREHALRAEAEIYVRRARLLGASDEEVRVALAHALAAGGAAVMTAPRSRRRGATSLD
jgi:GntR family transcriptional regulator